MSAEYRCDSCGAKLKGHEHDRLKLVLGHFAVEIIVRNGGTWNAGHVCHKCIRNIVAKGKP